MLCSKKCFILWSLLFSLVLSTPIFGQSSPSPVMPSYAEIWMGMSELEQGWFIRGFQVGIYSATDSLLQMLIKEHPKCLKACPECSREIFGWCSGITMPFTLPICSLDMIRSNVSTLYSDPANSKIEFGEMFSAALTKCQGKDISKMLQNPRERIDPILLLPKKERKLLEQNKDK